jgi:hypothetical protein
VNILEAERLTSVTKSTLATPEQCEVERFALALLGDAEVHRLMRDAIAEAVVEEPTAMLGRGADRLQTDVRMWTTSLILREAAGDPEAPRVVWVGDTGARTWFGHVLHGAALAGDNPDTIYRHAFVDGDEIYELLGRFPERPPAEFNIEPLPGCAGVIPASGTLTGRIGSVGGPALLTDRAIPRGSNGAFRIVFGGAPPTDGALHMPIPQGPVALNFRDVLGDWRQQPVELRLRRLSASRRPVLSRDELRSLVVAHLPAYLRHWRTFKDKWLGGFAPNAFKGPLGRDGSWSWILAGRYALEPGQVAILTARSGGAGYHGCQVTDRWEVTFDNVRHQASLNSFQVRPDPDGWVRYVLSPDDPGAPNWLDTAGCVDGLFLMRWQLFDEGFDANRHVQGYEVVSVDESWRRFPRIAPSERTDALRIRARDYASRFAEPGGRAMLEARLP